MESLQYRVKRLETEKRNSLQESVPTWEDMYDAISKSPKTEVGRIFSMKEFKESQPRTFTEMFDESGQKLSEKRVFEELYAHENEALKECEEWDEAEQLSEEEEARENVGRFLREVQGKLEETERRDAFCGG